MKILVTGGAGYIGSHAARALARKGHQVVLYDNLSSGHRSLAAGFELVVGDIADAGRLAPLLAASDAVMHFAAASQVGESVANPRKYFENNVRGGLTLLNAAVDAGIRAFVFSSSAAVYGTPASVPIPETAGLRPTNPYGATKVAFESALLAYEGVYGLRSAALRYFNAAGADESGEIGELHEPETHLIPSALSAAAGQRSELEIYGTDYSTPDGTCIRDYIHASDLATAHVLALEHIADKSESLTLNLGMGRGYSVQEVISTIERVTGKTVPRRECGRRPGDPAVLIADSTRARNVLGWDPRRTLEDMVASAWQFACKRAVSAAHG